MKRLLTLATIIAVFGVLLAAATASAQQQREEVMVVIPMKYMSAATAAQLFGGQIVSAAPLYGQNVFGNRGGTRSRYGGGNNGYGNGYGYNSGYDSGSYRSGPSIGGGYGRFGRSQSDYGNTSPYLR